MTTAAPESVILSSTFGAAVNLYLLHGLDAVRQLPRKHSCSNGRTAAIISSIMTDANKRFPRIHNLRSYHKEMEEEIVCYQWKDLAGTF